jgi:EAL domain-containing protein (putative c-di-GMP-specific phosphodiesterase class I)
VVGVEGLVRWNHPKLGMLSPDRFVHIAERSNLVRAFTLRIVEQALSDRAIMRATMPDATISVNLSAQNLLDSGLSLDVQRLLAKYGVSPEELVLEVTETTTPKDVIAADKVLNDLSDLGCHIAMDDFGSGYATMESLRNGSPIDEIKIDKGFIEHIVPNDRDRKVARAIIEIAHAWGCKVVAEGIENEETFQYLRGMGCDVAQGYWLHRPAPLPVILEWVRCRQERGDECRPDAPLPRLLPVRRA